MLLTQIKESFSIEFEHLSEYKKWLKAQIDSDDLLFDQLCKIFQIDPTQFLQKSAQYLNSEEIHQLDKDGFTIGAHSKKHKVMNKLTDSQIKENIINSWKEIKSLIDRRKIPFAFPHSANGISRALLQNIYIENDHVGQMFDTHGILQDEKFIINRKCADSPKNYRENKSNLPANLKNDYLEQISRSVHQLM